MPALSLSEPAARSTDDLPQLGQALLFSSELEQRMVEEEKEGRYTLERVKVRRPEAWRACCELLGAARPGYEGLQRIGRILGLHHLTVAAIRDDPDSRISIDTVRSNLAGKCRTGAFLLVDRILENPGLVPPAAIGMTIDQLVRNAELLDGRATSRTEHTERVDIHANWAAVLEALPSEKQLGAEDVLELPASGIGLAAGKITAVAATSSPADRDPNGPRDAESLAQTGDHEATVGSATASATDRTVLATDPYRAIAAAGAPSGGGGGSFEPTGGASDLIDPSSQKFSGNGPSSRNP